MDRTPNSLFTRREDGHIVGVLWNPNDRTRESQRTDYRIELADDGIAYTARLLLVDEHHANPYRAWELMGRERNPSRKQVALLKEASHPGCTYASLTPGDNGRSLHVSLEKNAVLLVDLIPVEDHAHEYCELDQEFYDGLSI